MDIDQLLSIQTDLMNKAHALMESKNMDYTGISDDALANLQSSMFVGVSTGKGILVRMLDKLKRLQSFEEKGFCKVKDESIEDTIIDIINYAILFAAHAKGYENDSTHSWI